MSHGAYEESWEPDIAERIRSIVETRQKDLEEKKNNDGHSSYPYCMVALCGIPGSGKTISSFLLANKLETYGIEATVLPMDGYHHFLEYLKTFPDPEDAIYRRGAPDTFDPQALLRDLHVIKDSDGARSNCHDVIHLPGFDHAKGDPEPGSHIFDPTKHKVLICEGLYLLHDADGWEEVASLFDLTVFMDADVDNCVERLKIRNQCIPGYSPEEIDIRCEKVDRVNAMTVMKSKRYADVVVKSPTVPVKESDRPEAPTAQLAALTLLEQKDVEEVKMHDDWTMELSSTFPRSPMISRNNSLVQLSEPPPPPASQFVGTWEPAMAERIIQVVDKAESDKGKLPFMVALIGGPGTGKSVSAMLLASVLEEKKYATMVAPHDGYHFSLDFLKTFPDSEDVIYRRGAPDTFDPRALLRDLERIKNGEETIIKLPGEQ